MKKPTTHRRNRMRPERRNVVEARIRITARELIDANQWDSGQEEMMKLIVSFLDAGFSVREIKRMVNTCAEIMDN